MSDSYIEAIYAARISSGRDRHIRGKALKRRSPPGRGDSANAWKSFVHLSRRNTDNKVSADSDCRKARGIGIVALWITSRQLNLNRKNSQWDILTN
jgi:hypothetical protein